MQKDTDIQTAEEAMSWIKDHLMGKNGILATIEQGGAIDEAERRKIGDAFEMIQQAWLGQQVIPKEGAQLLHQITTLIERVEQHIAFSSQRNQEMIDFLYQVNHWIDLIFFPPAAPISERRSSDLTNLRRRGDDAGRTASFGNTTVQRGAYLWKDRRSGVGRTFTSPGSVSRSLEIESGGIQISCIYAD